MDTTTPESLLSTIDVALILNVPVRKVQELINSGDLQAARIGKQYRIAPKELQRFLDALKLPIEVTA